MAGLARGARVAFSRRFCVRKCFGLLLALTLVASAAPASAAVINFDNLNFDNYDDIPTNYGSNGAGGAGHANVAVTYSGSGGGTDYLDFWNNDYGNLSKVAFTPANSTVARIDLTADPGFMITRLSFDLGGYNKTDLGARVLRYGIGADTVNKDGELIKGAGPSHSSFQVTAKGSREAFIEWGTNWNIGIDNISFDVARVQQVPEPASVTLLLGAAGLAAIRRRRQ